MPDGVCGQTKDSEDVTQTRGRNVEPPQTETISYGRNFHRKHHRPLRCHALVGVGHFPTWRRGMSAVYVLSALLVLGLFVYLLYALIKPEKF
jgi:K+-transporting ATPase KdpF subunit